MPLRQETKEERNLRWAFEKEEQKLKNSKNRKIKNKMKKELKGRKVLKITEDELLESIDGMEADKALPRASANGIAPNVHTVSYNEDVVKVESKDEDLIDDVVETTITTIPVPVVPVESIHDKYRRYINMVANGYLRDLSYADAMDMLRWMEKKRNQKIPINYSCNNCMFDLVKMFGSME